jgi:hypothetical protein
MRSAAAERVAGAAVGGFVVKSGQLFMATFGTPGEIAFNEFDLDPLDRLDRRSHFGGREINPHQGVHVDIPAVRELRLDLIESRLAASPTG